MNNFLIRFLVNLNLVFQFFNTIVWAEDTVSENIASENPTLSNSPSSNSAFTEDEVPLDAWIINKKVTKDIVKDTPTPEESDGISKKEADSIQLEEDKRVYKALLENYVSEGSEIEENNNPVEKNNINRVQQTVFTKTAISKKDEARFQKIKKIQRQVLKNQKVKFASLLEVKKNKIKSFRLCIGEVKAMGMPSDLRRLDQSYVTASITSDWKSLVKLTVQSECDIILVTGLYGKTIASGQEFMDKTVALLSKGSLKKWKHLSYPKGQLTFYSIIYNEERLKVEFPEEIDTISLRRGGDFIEDKFTLNPSQLIVEDLTTDIPSSNRLIFFDLKEPTSPLKKPKYPHTLQMASALLEVILSRSQDQNHDLNMLVGSLQATPSSAVSKVLRGIISPSDFLPERACSFPVVKEGVATEVVCDETKIEKKPRTLFGVFSDLVHEFNKKTKKSKHYSFSSDFFLPENSLNVIKETSNDLFPFGYNGVVFKGKQNPISFLWIDIKSEKRKD